MTKHFIHYLTREIKSQLLKDLDKTIDEVNDKSFFAEDQNSKDGFEHPMYHITRRQSGPVTKIEKGSVIWLFSILRSPWGTLPPSLDAKIIVERKEDLSDGRTKFHAGKNSRWFPLYDATSIIHKLKTIDNNGNEKKLWHENQKPLGLYLQSIRQLSGNHELTDWSNKISHSEFDFISYRIKDGTIYAFQKARSLMLDGKIVFWDRFSLPRRLVERREIVDNNALDDFLLEKIRSCTCFWGIETPGYFEPKRYSQKEAELAKQLKKYCSFQLS
jgi:hypothetical protein